MEDVRKIGFIGLGTMGLPMAVNLAKKGFEVTGYDVAPQSGAELVAAGGLVASTLRNAVAEADAVITMLPDGPIVDGVLQGEDGVLASMKPDAIYINMSTVLPSETDGFARAAAAWGIAMIDAPVGRSALEARRGSLLILAGGAAEDVSRATAAFLAMGNKIVDCGAVGDGTRAKIINNFMGISLNALTAEALTLAEATGLDLATALDVMRDTIAGHGHMRITYPNKVLRGDLEAGFPVDLAHKDLLLAVRLAAGLNAPAPMGAAALQSFSAARAAGRGRQDYTAVYPVLRQAAGLPQEIPYDSSGFEEYNPFSAKD